MRETHFSSLLQFVCTCNLAKMNAYTGVSVAMTELHQSKMQLLKPYKKLRHDFQAIHILFDVEYTFVQDINIFARNHVAVHNDFAV